MALFVGWWSLAEAATAFATSTFHLTFARFCLGLGEPGLWVAAPKAVGESFERPQRGLAIGIYTMGATVGAVVAIPVIAAITMHLPWKAVFLIDGAAGLIWLPFWLFVYRDGLHLPNTATMRNLFFNPQLKKTGGHNGWHGGILKKCCIPFHLQ